MAPRDFATRLTRRAARAGLFPNDELVEQLEVFYALLSRWNQKINLTSLADPDEAIDRLILEPLAAGRFVPSGAAAMMDIGSGGGSPAIPMKLGSSKLALTMVEVKVRKSAFLREATRHLKLTNTYVETARIEELLTRTDLHESFDVITMRAVRVEQRMLQTLQAFVRPGGRLLLFRGPSGPDAPAVVTPPLQWVETQPLLDTLQSRLTVLSKLAFGNAIVPRGTSS